MGGPFHSRPFRCDLRALAALVSIALPAMARDDWPSFLGPTGDGVSRERNLRGNWPADGPPLLWSADLGGGYAAPSIAAGRLYHFDRHAHRNRLTCRDAVTGVERWRYEHPTDYVDQFGYDGGPRCCPVVDGDRVYAYGAEGILTCVDAGTGKEQWQVDTVQKYGVVQNYFGVGSTPLVDDSRLIVAVGGSPAGPIPDDFRRLRSNGSAIVAFDKRTGRELYRTGGDLASYTSPVVRTVARRRLGFYLGRGGLLVFDPEAGKVVSQVSFRSPKLESVNAANPVVSENRILLSECYSRGSMVLEFLDGQVKPVWADEDGARDHRLECHWCTPILIGEFAYASSGRNSGNAELRCVEFATGRVCWREPNLGRCSLILADGHLIVLSEFGLLLMLKPNSRQFEEAARVDLGPQGRRLLKAPCWAAPVLANGLLYVRGEGRLICLDLRPSSASR